MTEETKVTVCCREHMPASTAVSLERSSSSRIEMLSLSGNAALAMILADRQDIAVNLSRPPRPPPWHPAAAARPRRPGPSYHPGGAGRRCEPPFHWHIDKPKTLTLKTQNLNQPKPPTRTVKQLPKTKTLNEGRQQRQLLEIQDGNTPAAVDYHGRPTTNSSLSAATLHARCTMCTSVRYN